MFCFAVSYFFKLTYKEVYHIISMCRRLGDLDYIFGVIFVHFHDDSYILHLFFCLISCPWYSVHDTEWTNSYIKVCNDNTYRVFSVIFRCLSRCVKVSHANGDAINGHDQKLRVKFECMWNQYNNALMILKYSKWSIVLWILL